MVVEYQVTIPLQSSDTGFMCISIKAYALLLLYVIEPVNGT